ncbi:MAG: hypothetical protein M1822_007650 [Bathelium mastoideum]|nr:MAG: hypothetical protein M1822_007650 [Bathelium mastoideum]
MVELSASIGGPAWSSYAVQEKQQVAEIDPSMILDDDELFDGPLGPPCMVCEEIGDDETLLLCDGCEAACHVECANLQRVPAGPWYCYHCQEDERVHIPEGRPSRANHTHRTRASQRRSRRAAHDPWARVWQSVWHRINLDLDFPFDHDDEPTQRQTEAERREFLEYQRRYEIAARQGGAQRFRAIAPTLLDRGSERTTPAEPSEESQEEIRAWNAFEKARQIADNSQPSNRRKRKSMTPDPEPEQQRKYKRPRATRAREAAAATDGHTAESSRAALSRGASVAQRSGNLRVDSDRGTTGSNFLQSLLKEVETSHTPTTQQNTIGSPLPTSESHQSPHPSSPDSSPAPSNYGTPRAVSTTPPPEAFARRTSPTPLTSSVLPIFPAFPKYSPSSPADGAQSWLPSSDAPALTHSNRRFPKYDSSPTGSPPRFKAASPTRNNSNLPYSTKQEIQEMVSSALKPRYKSKELNRDQFTDINRDISRRLYDRIGGAGALEAQKDREHWQRVAAEEVENALKVLGGGGGTEVKAATLA